LNTVRVIRKSYVIRKMGHLLIKGDGNYGVFGGAYHVQRYPPEDAHNDDPNQPDVPAFAHTGGFHEGETGIPGVGRVIPGEFIRGNHGEIVYRDQSVNIEVGLTSGGNPKITGLFKPNGGVQSMDTINEITDFELETYLDEFRDKSSDASKKMCDIWEGMTAWMQDEIKTSLEYVDVMRKFDEKPNGVEGLAAIANKRPNEKVVNQDDEKFIDDDIPF